MNAEELDKMAEEYIEKNCKMWEEGELTVDEIVRLTYKDCAKENGVQWHKYQLENGFIDCPQEEGDYLFYLKDEEETYTEVLGLSFDGNGNPYLDSMLWTMEQVIAWCEIPQFKEE